MTELTEEQKAKIKTLIKDWFGETIINDDDWEIFATDLNDIIKKM